MEGTAWVGWLVVLVPVTAIIAWAVVEATKHIGRDAGAEKREAAIMARLDAIDALDALDARLEHTEKTLNDIS